MQDSQQQLWQYISKIRPKLRGHVEIYPQVYRGERWYVLHDRSSGQYLRLNKIAYEVLGRFDGDATLEEIYEHIHEEDTQNAFTQEEILHLIGQLNASEVLSEGLPINVQDAFGQYQAQLRKKRHRALMNPLAIKIPLFNPDRVLTHFSQFAQLLFSKVGFWLWALTVISALVMAVTHKDALLSDLGAIELSPGQLILLWVIYPLVIAMHELGHGLALKASGGHVPQMGVNLLVFMPVPYVDATSSWGIRNKWRRMSIGAAGIFVELFLAALALFLWSLVEAGIVKDIALNVIIIATLSTLLFNGNPLLKYDGYFILEDWLEIPNLATRAKAYYYYLVQKYALRLETAHSPVTAEGERKWLLFYGFLSPLYRIIILLVIALYLIDGFVVIGVALAGWVFIMQVLVPLAKGVHFLNFSQAVAARRSRGVAFTIALVVAIVGVMLLPVSTVTSTQGVVWSGGELSVGSAGFVKKVHLPSGSDVKQGDTILTLENPELESKYKKLRARLDELEAYYISEERHDRVRSAMIQDDISAVKMQLTHTQEQIEKLTLHSPISGKLIFAKPHELLGTHMNQGDVLGHVINDANIVIRATVPQARIGLLEKHESQASFKLSEDLTQTYEGEIIREVPKSILRIPSPALGIMGGGNLAVDPNDDQGTKLLKPVFQVDIGLPDTLHLERIGGRVYVRLDHGKLPVGEQIALSFNQLFLKHFYAK